MNTSMRLLYGMISGLFLATTTQAAVTSATYDLDVPDPTSAVQVLNGLSARATFTLDDANPFELVIELTNTSTGVPTGFGNNDQLLTAISFDFGEPGYNGDPEIIGGTVILGPGGTHFNMDVSVGPGDDLSGEWGFGNMDGTGLLTNLVTSTNSQATPFGGANLDAGVNIDGPQAGIATNPPLVPMSGLGAVTDSVIITLTLDQAHPGLSDLNFLDENGIRAEFGSDAAYVTPEPATLSLLVLGALTLTRRRR